MNFNQGGPSYVYSFASSSLSNGESDNEVQLTVDLEVIDAQQESVFRLYSNNNHLLIAQHLNQQTNHLTPWGGSILGHVVINRDREKA